jgi:hypothetical protein
VNVTKTSNVNEPILTEYLYLYSKYPQTLTCPCKKAAIKYEKFLRINYTLHQLCSSTFVTNDWIAYLAQNRLHEIKYLKSFQSVGTYIFQALKALCQSTNRTISDSLSRVYLNEYATLNVISETLLQSQSQILMEQFISSTSNAFLSLLQTLRDTTQANTLMSALQTNYFFLIDDGDNQTSITPQDYNCSCMSSPACIEPLAIYGDDNLTVIFTVPGLHLGCFIVQGVLQSTLECFYNQTCIDTLQSYIISSTEMYNVSCLDSSLSSRYNETSTIQELVNQLMVEKWNLSSTYENYYKECQPIKCTYSYVTKNDVLYIATTILSLIGGLATVLKFVIPQLVKFIPRLIKIIRRYLGFSRLETGKIGFEVSFNCG